MMKKLLLPILMMLILSSPKIVLAAASLSLSPSTGTFNKGCNFSLTVVLDTGGSQTDGADSILIFDISKLSAVPPVANGTIYSDYPGNNIDPTGKVTISGLASVTSPFAGKGTLATVNFKVADTAAAGATQITFDFDPNNKSKTTDSNVIERGTIAEILGSVVNGTYTVGTGSCATQTPTDLVPTPPGNKVGPGRFVGTPSSQPVYQTPSSGLDGRVGGKTGTSELTATIAIIGGILTVLGILGLALL